MIPKIIHYCWFGKKSLSENNLECIESWKKHNPEFEFKRWDETNYELKNNFVKQAYRDKNFAYVADYCRLDVLYDYGGIYLDTDMLVLKPFDNLLENKCFLGFENDWTVSCGIIGTLAQNKFIGELKSFYENTKFDIKNRIPITKLVSDKIREKTGLRPENVQQVEDIVIFPASYFYPMPTGNSDYIKFITEESYTVHLWDFTWQDEFYLLQQGRAKDATLRILKNKFLNKAGIDNYYKNLLRSYPKGLFKWIRIKLGIYH